VSDDGAIPIGLVIGQLTAGGAEGQLALLARALRGTRYRPIVYCVSGNREPIGRELEEDGVELRVFPGPRPGRVLRLSRALAADGVRLVHAWLFIANSYAWLANRGRRPLITSARNCKRQGWLHDRLNRRAFRRSERIVANSHQVKDYIEHHYGAPAERITVIHNGIDVERFRPAGEGAPAETRIVGIGRLVPQKDPELFLRAASMLAAERPDIRFAFVGEGPLRPRLEAEVARLGLGDRISLPGETRDVAGVLRGASLFWLTSAWEGLPNVVMEAMACGVPVIAADVGGTRELVRPGIEGHLVAAGDAAALVRHSRDVLGDPARLALFARRARERALEFSTANMVQALLHLYSDSLRPEP
jgi:glycosyltransferase involved in cell wall biosynthesis